MEKNNFCQIKNETKGISIPVGVPFVSIKNKILGKNYDLSICFLPYQKQKKINDLYRQINKSTTILSFPLSKKSGEIIFDLKKVKKEAKNFHQTYPQFLKSLFIHGLLHLKGFQHSSTMEKEEDKYLKFFS
jgi:probable rRNA maturation factor